MTIEADVRAMAAQFGLDPRLLQAVVNAEGNIVKAVQCSIPSVQTREKALDVTCRSAVHAMSDFLHERGLQAAFVEFWQKRWAPNGATNDPTQLNANWSTNVKRLWGVVALVLLCVSPAVAQSVVADLTDARASYPTPMSQAQIGELLTGVATRHPGFVLLRKDTGNHCPTPMGIFVACDILVDASTGQGYDVLRDQEGAGAVQWALSDRFPAERFVSPITAQPVPTPIPQPPPVPVPVLDLSPILTRIDALFSQNERIYADLTNQHHDQTATLKAAIDSPAWYAKLFGNHYVQLALATATTYFATHQAMK
jgi:hypothetical protein